MKDAKVTAKNFRLLISSLTAIITIGTAIGFFFFQDWISNIDNREDKKVATNQTQISSKNTTSKSDINKANSLIPSSRSYQNTIKQDITKYAYNTGISIGEINFSQAGPSVSGISLPSGIESVSVTITVNNPTKYLSFLQFLKLIETNNPKMQPSSVEFSSPINSGESVNVDKLTIEIFIR